MRQIHRAGEKLFADYAGPSVPIIDAATGEMRPASIFVAVLGASSYTFACATPGQTQVDWLTGLGRVPDNPRALVANANRYEPTPIVARTQEHPARIYVTLHYRSPQLFGNHNHQLFGLVILVRRHLIIAADVRVGLVIADLIL